MKTYIGASAFALAVLGLLTACASENGTPATVTVTETSTETPAQNSASTDSSAPANDVLDHSSAEALIKTWIDKAVNEGDCAAWDEAIDPKLDATDCSGTDVKATMAQKNLERMKEAGPIEFASIDVLPISNSTGVEFSLPGTTVDSASLPPLGELIQVDGKYYFPRNPGFKDVADYIESARAVANQRK